MQLLVNSLVTGSIYALASSGLSLTYGLLKILNFAHGHILMAGAYIFYAFYVESSLDMITAGMLTALLIGVLSYLSLKVFVLPFTEYSFVLAFVTTLTLGTLLESAISIIFGVSAHTINTSLGGESFEFWGAYITANQVVIILSALILLSIVAAIVHQTSVGRRIRAIASHPQAAQSIGISRRRTCHKVFLLSSLLAAFAGILIGYETNIQPTMGGSYTIKAFAAMILGGLGNIWGTVAGSYLLGILENFSIGLDFGAYSVPAGYKDAFAFMAILLVLMFKPQGLFSSGGRKV